MRAELCPDGYNFMGQNRIGRGEGGTGIMYRDSLNVKRIDGGEHKSFEFSEWMVSSRSTKKLRVVIIYRPPYFRGSSGHSSDFLLRVCKLHGIHPLVQGTACYEKLWRDLRDFEDSRIC